MNDSDPRLPQDENAPRRRRRRLNYTDMPASNLQPPHEPINAAPPKESAPNSRVQHAAPAMHWPRWPRKIRPS